MLIIRYVLAFANTCHAVQGQTFEHQIFYIASCNFDPTMPYVAASRTTLSTNFWWVDVAFEVYATHEQKCREKANSHKSFDKAKGLDPNATVTAKQIAELYEGSGGQCWHCGVQVRGHSMHRHDEQVFSVDRVDDAKGHSVDNVRIACWPCNNRHSNTK